MHPRHALLLAAASLLAAAPQPALAQCVHGVPSVRNEGAQLVLCPGAGDVTRAGGGLEVGRLQSGQGSLNITTAPGETVLINGVDVLGELRELKALCGACSRAVPITTAHAATTTTTGSTTPKVFSNASQIKLTAVDAAAGDHFGTSVSTSGTTIVVGAYQDDDGATNSGSMYVFIQTGTTWTQQAKLVASDAAGGDWLGVSVAISGNTIVVGAQHDGDGGTHSGSAYVFTRSGTTWTQQAKLTASDAAADDLFGRSVAISGDTIVVGAHNDDDAGANSGAAYVFQRAGTTWTHQAKLAAPDAAGGDSFGESVAVSGSTIVVGARRDDDMFIDSGSVYVFTRTGTIWTQQQKLTAADADTISAGPASYFGVSVAINGNTIVVGASFDDVGGTDSGATYVYISSGSTWTHQGKLVASDAAAGDLFGHSVDISGNIIVVGANLDSNAGANSGSAYVFIRSGTTWTQQAKLTAADAAGDDQFGTSVAITDGVVVVGANQNDNAGPNSGSAYVF